MNANVDTRPNFVRLPFVSEKDSAKVWKRCNEMLADWKTKHDVATDPTKCTHHRQNMLDFVWESNVLEDTLPSHLNPNDPHYNDYICSDVALQHHLEAMEFAFRFPFETLTEHFVKKIHFLMMTGKVNEHGMSINAGEYRKMSVMAGDHRFPCHESVGESMENIVDRHNSEQSKPNHDPYRLASNLFFDVVSVHPFEDGNGRTSRILWAYSLAKDGLPFVPVLGSEHAKKSQKHLVKCITKDRCMFYGDRRHLTTLTLDSVNRAWKKWNAICEKRKD